MKKGTIILLLIAFGIAGIFGGIAITEGSWTKLSQAAFNRVYALGVVLIVAGALSFVVGMYKAFAANRKDD